MVPRTARAGLSPVGSFFDPSSNWAGDGGIAGQPGEFDTAYYFLSGAYPELWDNITGNRTNAGLIAENGFVTLRSNDGVP